MGGTKTQGTLTSPTQKERTFPEHVSKDELQSPLLKNKTKLLSFIKHEYCDWLTAAIFPEFVI